MPAASPVGFLGALAPLAWVVTAAAFACTLLGLTALGSFLIGRLLVTGVLVAFGWIVLIGVDTLSVGAEDVARSPRLSRLCRTFSLRPELLALASIVVSGLLHALVVGAMVFVVIGPWSLAHGDLNPFQDAFLGTTVADLRGWIGAAGLALFVFGLGLLATRLATGWLDRRFLPQTRLDAGARYSVITVVGYGGLAVTLVAALGQLGVNPQSLTVIAGALSVGIGFGLQSIVSNFVSGLIVLAERPVRVGDLVTVKGEEGRVKKISVRSTLIATGDRTDLVVPNTDLITSIVRNKTLTDDTSACACRCSSTRTRHRGAERDPGQGDGAPSQRRPDARPERPADADRRERPRIRGALLPRRPRGGRHDPQRAEHDLADAVPPRRHHPRRAARA